MNNVTVKYLINKNVIYFSVPFVNPRPIAVVPPGLPSSIDISALFFRGIKPYRDYDLLDEVLRQSDHLDEREKIKWMTRWMRGEGPIQY